MDISSAGSGNPRDSSPGSSSGNSCAPVVDAEGWVRLDKRHMGIRDGVFMPLFGHMADRVMLYRPCPRSPGGPVHAHQEGKELPLSGLVALRMHCFCHSSN